MRAKLFFVKHVIIERQEEKEKKNKTKQNKTKQNKTNNSPTISCSVGDDSYTND